jgi:hypothetical protein
MGAMYLIRRGEEPEEISAERWDSIALHVRQREFLATPKRKSPPKKRKRYQVSESTRSQRAFMAKALAVQEDLRNQRVGNA